MSTIKRGRKSLQKHHDIVGHCCGHLNHLDRLTRALLTATLLQTFWGISMRLPVQLFLPALTGVWLVGCSCNRDDNLTPQPDPEETFNDIGSWLGMSVMPNGDPAVSYYDRTKGGLGFAIGKLVHAQPSSGFDETASIFPPRVESLFYYQLLFYYESHE